MAVVEQRTMLFARSEVAPSEGYYYVNEPIRNGKKIKVSLDNNLVFSLSASPYIAVVVADRKN